MLLRWIDLAVKVEIAAQVRESLVLVVLEIDAYLMVGKEPDAHVDQNPAPAGTVHIAVILTHNIGVITDLLSARSDRGRSQGEASY